MAFGNLSSGSNQDQPDDLAEINIIPLVDVMLVLLIVFMVAAPLSISGIKVQLPTSKARGTSVDESRIILSIDKGGNYFVDKMPIPRPELEKRIHALFEFREKKELFIRADRGVYYGAVVDAMSAAKLAGVNKMAMLTQPLTQKAESETKNNKG
ncbi:MAG: biopolymer transporter ExbD [Bdellovibrionota bacterium]